MRRRKDDVDETYGKPPWPDGATEATALWDIGAVLSVIADTAGDQLMSQVLAQVPEDWPPLFGSPVPAGMST